MEIAIKRDGEVGGRPVDKVVVFAVKLIRKEGQLLVDMPSLKYLV